MRRRTGPLVLTLALGAALSVLWLPGPAGAAGTADAQLSLSGIVSAAAPAGAPELTVRQGDTVRFAAAPAPTAGLATRGLGGLLGPVTGYQVSLRLPAAFPGGARTVVLGAQGQADYQVTLPAAGRFSVSWTAKSRNLLGELVPITLDGAALRNAGIALSAGNAYLGTVVVAANARTGGTTAAPPRSSAAPPSATTAPSDPGRPAAPPPTLAARASAGDVLPAGAAPGTNSAQKGADPTGEILLDAGLDADRPGRLGSVEEETGSDTPAPDYIALSAGGRTTGDAPVLLAVVAMVALALVTAGYARLYLLRRDQRD